jgi:predicted TIM-barrel fold metal-dependent hydrolase
MRRDVYSGYSRLYDEENNQTLSTANNLAGMLCSLKHFEEAKSLMRKTMPVARRVLGEGHDLMFTMSTVYAASLYEDSAATLDDLREAVTTLEDTARTARRVFGSDHPLVGGIEEDLRVSRAVLRARETPSSPGRS